MTKIRVFAKRPTPLDDLNIVTIDPSTVPFDVALYEQIDDKEPELMHTETFDVSTEQPIPPEPTPPEQNLLYDSNRDGHWDNGTKRVVKDKEGDVGANGKGLYTAASGDPIFEIDGKGTGTLICKAGHGRIYICACNYNSVLEKEFCILDGNVDNVSDKLRCRHQEGGACENRFGGFGGSISVDECGVKIELCHNVHADSKSKDLPRRLEIGKWYKDRFQIRDSEDGKSVLATRWLDYGDGKGFVETLVHRMTKITPYMMEKATYDKKSYFWLRMNNEAPGKIAFKNVKLFNIP